MLHVVSKFNLRLEEFVTSGGWDSSVQCTPDSAARPFCPTRPPDPVARLCRPTRPPDPATWPGRPTRLPGSAAGPDHLAARPSRTTRPPDPATRLGLSTRPLDSAAEWCLRRLRLSELSRFKLYTTICTRRYVHTLPSQGGRAVHRL